MPFRMTPIFSRRAVLAGSAAVVAFREPSLAAARTEERTSQNLDVTFEVNGRAHSLRLDPRTTLLDALREHLLLTGTKKGCDHGQCGACIATHRSDMAVAMRLLDAAVKP